MAVRKLRLNESVNNNDNYGVHFISDVDVKTNINALYDSINNIIQKYTDQFDVPDNAYVLEKTYYDVIFSSDYILVNTISFKVGYDIFEDRFGIEIYEDDKFNGIYKSKDEFFDFIKKLIKYIASKI